MNTRPLMTMQVKVARVLDVGAVPMARAGLRRSDGGMFEGPRLRGTVLPGSSADWLLLRPDGVLELDFRATLETDDGALISMKSFGLRHGPPESSRRSAGVRRWILRRTTSGRCRALRPRIPGTRS